MKTSKQSAPQYDWGTNRNGWHLVDQPQMSVLQEKMRPGYTEARHFHENSGRFFFVLNGTLSVEIEGQTVDLQSHEGLAVAAGAAHRVFNRSPGDADYLVMSQP